MKHIFYHVMILSLLLFLCGCKNNLSPKHVTEPEISKEQNTEELDSNERQTNNESETQINKSQEIETKKDETEEVILSEVLPPKDETKENETGKNETPQENEGCEAQDVETPEENEAEENETNEIDQPVISLLQINELCTEFSALTKRAEYIEFKVVEPGNLEGVILYITYADQDFFIYKFPAVDVAKGEYITLHLRTLESVCIDELGEDLSLSGGTTSCRTARDLWIVGSDKWLLKTDIVFLKDAKGKIMDAIIMNEKPSVTWDNNHLYFADIVENLYNYGMWKTANGQKPTPLDTVDTSTIGTYAYKSISRYEERENTHTANDWYITANGYITPGQPNN